MAPLSKSAQNLTAISQSQLALGHVHLSFRDSGGFLQVFLLSGFSGHELGAKGMMEWIPDRLSVLKIVKMLSEMKKKM